MTLSKGPFPLVSVVRCALATQSGLEPGVCGPSLEARAEWQVVHSTLRSNVSFHHENTGRRRAAFHALSLAWRLVKSPKKIILNPGIRAGG